MDLLNTIRRAADHLLVMMEIYGSETEASETAEGQEAQSQDKPPTDDTSPIRLDAGGNKTS